MQHNIYFTLCARVISINKLRPGCNVAFHKIVSNLHGSEKSLLFLPIFIRFGTCEMLKCYPGSRGFSWNCSPRKMQRLNRAKSLSGDCTHWRLWVGTLIVSAESCGHSPNILQLTSNCLIDLLVLKKRRAKGQDVKMRFLFSEGKKFIKRKLHLGPHPLLWLYHTGL